MSVLFGSGVVEKNLIIDIKNRKNFGNNFRTLSLINKPKKFFHLLSSKKIHFPKTRFEFPISKIKWLKKDIGSCGGIKVFNLKKNEEIINQNEYLQEYINGEILSSQFFVKDKKIKFFIICSQWIKKTKTNPFKLEGIKTTKINEDLQNKIFKTSKKITYLFNLNGLNSIDFIVPRNKKIPIVIDLNPRPGLSINILSKIYKNNLFSFEKEITDTKRIYATIIVYAKKKLFINLNIYNKLYKLKNSNNYSE